MKSLNIFLVVAALAVSAAAAHIFFKAADVAPLELELARVQSDIDRNRLLADKGDVYAQHRLGNLYRTAKPPLQNYAKALIWYEKSANRGHPGSQYALGQMYANGRGVQQNYYKAAEWYRLASNLAGLADAQFSLGELYFNGRGVPSSYGLAIEWYTKAANQGHAVAQYFLGQINKEGWGADENLIEAYKWLKLADRHADQVLAHSPRNDTKRALASLTAKMNNSQIAAGEKALAAWKPGR
ncbi:MAG: sel1 repeat family protein [Rhodospirillales bacterium]|nr:sel1 repeat family protein [Rhodospirillales bacterium]